MVRFTAHTSDLSDNDSDGGSEETQSPTPSPPRRRARGSPHPPRPTESDESSSSATSSDDEEESESSPPLPPRKGTPKPNALVQDSAGEIHFAHEITPRDEQLERPSSQPQRARTSRDDSAVPWPQQVGVDPDRMHVMQASLFRLPEEEAMMRETSAPAKRPVFLIQKSMQRKHGRGLDFDSVWAESRERVSFANKADEAPSRPTAKYARVESADSVVRGSERSVVDAGLSLGRSFRVGWGPGGTLAHLGALCSPLASSTIPANSSVVSITQVPLVTTTTREAFDRLAPLLEHQLRCSTIIPDENGIPYAKTLPKLDFASMVTLYPATDQSYDASLFRLGHALFGQLDLQLGESVTNDIRNRIASLRRKAAVSAWLEDHVGPSVEADLKKTLPSDSAAISFTLLTGNQIEKATEAAIAGHNFKLATLISQGSGDTEFQADLLEQLTTWREHRIDAHISDSILRVYAVLAGWLNTIQGSTGTGPERCSDIVVCKGLDWKRVYGLHLWFAEPGEAPLPGIFQAYDQFWRENHTMPSIAPASPHPRSSWNLPPDSTVPSATQDALFSLLKLQADPACSLSHILNPLSFSASPVDSSLPWHLYSILARGMRLRDFADRTGPFDDTSSGRGGGHSLSADLLTSSYAFQLERLGMLQEAVFVLLHLESSFGRKKAITDLLLRSAPGLNQYNVRGFIKATRIPPEWVHESKAIYALASGHLFHAYEYYLSAGLFDQAHDLAVLDLAPDAINRNDLVLLKRLLEPFVARQVDGWHERGKRLYDYAHIVSRSSELQALIEEKRDVPESVQAELDEMTKAIPPLIAKLPLVLYRSDPTHCAALADMTAQLSRLLRPINPDQSLVQPMFLGGAARLRHIHSTAYERFLNTIQVV